VIGQQIGPLMRLLPAAGKWLTAGLLVTAVLQPALSLGFILATGVLVGHIPDLPRVGLHGPVIAAFAAVAGCYLGQQVVSAVGPTVANVLGRRVDTLAADRLMSTQLAPAGIAHLQDARRRDLVERATGGLGAGRWRPAESPGALAALISSALAVAAVCVVAVWLRWWVGVPVAAATVWFGRRMWGQMLRMTLDSVEAEHIDEYRRVAYELETAVAPGTAKEIRVFGFAAWLLDRVRLRQQRLLGFDLRHMAHTTGAETASYVTYIAIVGAAVVAIGVEAARGSLSLATATVLAQAVLAPMSSAQPGFQALIDLRQSTRPIRALQALEPEPPAAAAGVNPRELPVNEIRFTDVTFRYPGTDVNVLDGVDLTLRGDRSLALVGLNGAGKSTLVNLLCGFYSPTSGVITVDGVDLASLDMAAWQSRVAAIFQDFAHYPFTAADNVRVAHLDATASQIRAAAAVTGADAVLAHAGWQTPLSRELTGGVDLSGGQWQRLALARAILACDTGARVLILDEPSANLDIRAEADLNDRFLDLARGTATVVVSHRFSTVRRADSVCVLDGGRIVEHGSHDELVRAGGVYSRLFRLQAARFG